MSWTDDAACRNVPKAVFFPTKKVGRKGPEDPPDDASYYTAARSVCNRCPVRSDCLEEALVQVWDRWGMWGGLTPMERRAVRQQRRTA